jgi:hypothetical protein
MEEIDATKEAPPRTLLRWFGQYVFGARIMGIPMYEIYPCLKYLRRIYSFPLDVPCVPWRSALNALKFCLQQVCSAPPRALRDPPGEECWTLYSDACLSGWGAVIFAPPSANFQSPWVSCGPFLFSEDIQNLEARALKYALHALPVQNKLTRIKIMVDNSSVHGGFRRGHHRNFVVNLQLRECATILAAKNFVIDSLLLIKSFENLADEPSRTFEI